MDSVKIRYENTTDRAILCAFLAFCAKRVIDSCKIINNLYCARSTVFLTLFASDAGIRAFLTSHSTLILIVAGNHNSLYVCHKADYAPGTGARAQAATDALSRIDMRHSVFNADSVLRADRYAISKTDATGGGEGYSWTTSDTETRYLGTLSGNKESFTAAGTLNADKLTLTKDNATYTFDVSITIINNG